MEIKQTKMNFLVFISIRFSVGIVLLHFITHVLQKYVLGEIEHVHHIWVMSHFAYVDFG